MHLHHNRSQQHPLLAQKAKFQGPSKAFLSQDLDFVVRGLVLKASQQAIKRHAHLQTLQAGAMSAYRRFLLENFCHLGDNAYNLFRLHIFLFKPQINIIAWKQGNPTTPYSSFNPIGIYRHLMEYIELSCKNKIV